MYIHVRDIHVHDILQVCSSVYCLVPIDFIISSTAWRLPATFILHKMKLVKCKKYPKLTLPLASIAYLHQRNYSVCVSCSVKLKQLYLHVHSSITIPLAQVVLLAFFVDLMLELN